jgi:hypothetical protein
VSGLVTFDEEYKQRLQLKAEVWSPDWQDLILDFNQDAGGALGNNPLQIVQASISNSIDSYGSFNLTVKDTHGVLRDRTIDHRYIIKFKAKKPFQSTYQNLQTSIVRKIARLYNEGSNERLYRIQGPSVGSILTHTIINYSLQSKYKNVTIGANNIDKNDPEMLAPKHIERIFTDRKVLPALTEGLTVQERGNFGLGKINHDINVYINAIDVFGTTPSELGKDIANSSACLFLVDEDNEVFFDRPLNRTLGHYITNNSDNMQLSADTTLMTNARVEDVSSTFAEDGYFDKLYAYSSQSTVTQANTDMGGYTPLHRNDVAFRIPQAGATQLWDLAFMLQKFGVGTDSDDPSNTFLHGLIVNDNNFRVGTEIIGEFYIPVSYISNNVTWANRVNPDFRKDVEVDKAYWIVLKKIGNSAENTIGWWHDNNTNQKNVYSAYRFSRGRNETAETLKQGWSYLTTGPKYTYSISQRTPTLQTSFSVNFNPKYKTLAPVERFETINWIKDDSTDMQYLAYVTQQASRVKRDIDLGDCSIPNVLPRIGYANVLELKQTDAAGVTDLSSYIFNMNSTVYNFDIIGARWVKIKGDTYDLNIENVIEDDQAELLYVCDD